MIALLTSSFPDSPLDHRGRFVMRFAQELTGRGLPVRVVRPAPAGGAAAWQPAGLAVRAVGPFGGLYGGDGIPDNLRQRPWEAGLLPVSGWGLGRALIDEARRAELVIAHWLLPAGLIAAATRPLHRRPVWVVCHSGGVAVLERLPGPIRRGVAEILGRGVDRFTFVTERLRGRFLEAMGRLGAAVAERSGVLPMGADVEAFSGARPDPSGPVVVVGRLVPIKGGDLLIEALCRLGGAPPLRVVGDGPERLGLARQADRAAIAVEWMGALPPTEVPAALDGCRLAVVPSRVLPGGRREGMPIFAIEALAAGLPLLATDTFDLPFEGVAGVFRAAASVDGLARGIERALGERSRPGDTDARRRAAEELSWAKIGERAAGTARALIADAAS